MRVISQKKISTLWNREFRPILLVCYKKIILIVKHLMMGYNKENEDKVANTMKIYMDNCCLNRPFDDLTQDRIYLEAEAVLAIVSRCEKHDWSFVSSGALDYEISKITETERQAQVQTLYSIANERIKISDEIETRAAFFQGQGLKPFDSLHLALAENGRCDVFLTTDDHLLNGSKRLNLNITVANPVSWLMEVITDEQ
jgi:predicted nucleic acid-binding protein